MKNKYIKIFSLAFALIFVGRVYASAVYVDGICRKYASVELIQNGDMPTAYSAPLFSLTNEALESATELLVAGLQNVEGEINLSSVNLSTNNLKDLYQGVMNSHPELFYVGFEYGYTCDNNGFIEKVYPIYTMTTDEINAKTTQYIFELENIVSKINTTFSDLEKIVFVHDYLCANYSYDKSESVFDAYSFLVHKTGVCQSYTLAFIAIMNELNIDVGYAASDSMNHIWNIVKVGNSWYHIDITWDDTYKQMVCGQVKHSNFLLSDYGIKSTGHSNWYTNIDNSCSDSTYDTYFWNDISLPFVWVGNKCFALVEGTCYEVNLSSGKLTFSGIDTEWMYSGIASYEDMLLLGYKNSVKAYDTKGVYLYDVYVSEVGSNIYGLNANSGVLTFAQSNKFSSDLTFNQSKCFLSKDMFSVDLSAEIYEGKEIKKVIHSSLNDGTSYNIFYDKNNQTGTAKIELMGCDDYCGKIIFEFYICDRYMFLDCISDVEEYINAKYENVYYNLYSCFGYENIYGTGSVLQIYSKENNVLIDSSIFVVEGDLNGDSVCDVLDAATAQLYSAGFQEPTVNEILAANGCIADEIDVNAYQNVVNIALTS